VPTCEYECQSCGKRFEIEQGNREPPLTNHPGECRGRLIHLGSKDQFSKDHGWTAKSEGSLERP